MVLGLVLAVQQSSDYPALPARENGLLHHSSCYCLPLVASGTPELVAPVGHSQAALADGQASFILYISFCFSERQLSRTFLYKKLQNRSEQLSLSSSPLLSDLELNVSLLERKGKKNISIFKEVFEYRVLEGLFSPAG